MLWPIASGSRDNLRPIRRYIMKERVIALLTAVLLLVAVFVVIRQTEACDEWKTEVRTRFEQVDAVGLGSDIALSRIERDMDDRRPLGCSL